MYSNRIYRRLVRIMIQLTCSKCFRPLTYGLSRAFGEEISIKVEPCDCETTQEKCDECDNSTE